jgi:hypothetical protein
MARNPDSYPSAAKGLPTALRDAESQRFENAFILKALPACRLCSAEALTKAMHTQSFKKKKWHVKEQSRNRYRFRDAKL